MKYLVTAWLVVFTGSILFCGKSSSDSSISSEKNDETGKSCGTLIFTANGEDFVRQGFQDKDGWNLSFDNLWVNLSQVQAISVDGKHSIRLQESFLVDLTSNRQDGHPVAITTKINVPAAEYRKIEWMVSPAESGEQKGYSFVMTGKATKGEQVIPFTIKLDETIQWSCREGYSGRILKGFVKENQTGEVEMTFHFDHIFGDAELPVDDHVNANAVGFSFFLPFMKDGQIEVEQETLIQKSDPEMFNKFINALHGLGHSGEQHADLVYKSTSVK